MITVKQILAEKGSQVWTISQDANVFSALKLMAEKGVGALIVLENDRCVGMMSERDYARKIALLGKQSQDTPVRDIMSTKIYVVGPETTAEECMALMTDKRIRHLPVFRDDKLVGIVSIGDVVKAVIDEQKFTIKNLENYIIGKYQ